MRYKLIVFDLDGTLFDTVKDIHCSLIYILKKNNCTNLPTLEQSMQFIGGGLTDFVHKGFSYAEASKNYPVSKDVVDDFLNYYSSNSVCQTVPYEDTLKTVSELYKKGFLLAVLSNKSERLVRYILAHFNLAGYFSFIAGGDTFVEKKPSPLPLLEISRIFGTNDVLMVGDSHNDIDAGAKAKFDTVYCSYGYGKAVNSKPTYSIDNILKLGDIVI